MIKKLMDQWNAYVGPKDERIVAEENRHYAKLAKALLVIVLATMYYGNALRRAAGMFDDVALGGKYFSAFPPEMALSLGVVISCTAFSLALTKQGLIANNRFAEVDTCPTGYFATCSGIAAALIVLCVFVVESLAQAQFVGFAGVYWKANLAMAVVYATMVFIGCIIGLVLYYRRARANQRRIEAELED